MLPSGLFGRINFPNDYITGDRLKIGCDMAYEMGHNPAHLRMVCACKRVFVKTDFIDECLEAMQMRTTKCVLISHNSDFPITERLWIHKPEKIVYWYATNVRIKQDRLVPIPFGCENMKSPGYSGNMGIIERILACRVRDWHNLAFINFNPRTNQDEREPILDLFSEQPWVTYMPYGVDFEQTMKATRQHKFVFAPAGNGGCTHRMWEAIYLGVIPIVKRNVHTEYFQDLPIVLVDNWGQINKEMLTDIWNEYSNREWNMEKATLRYWKRRINTWDGEFSKEGPR